MLTCDHNGQPFILVLIFPFPSTIFFKERKTRFYSWIDRTLPRGQGTLPAHSLSHSLTQSLKQSFNHSTTLSTNYMPSHPDRTVAEPLCSLPQLDGSTTLKPLYLDEEWCLRRSERIFLSEPSPQPSPNNQQPGAKQDKTFFTPRPSKTQNDRDRAKVQKAKSLQELSQKVKRKYTKNMNKKTSFSEDRFNVSSEPHVLTFVLFNVSVQEK